MPSTLANIITTTLLTLICAAALFLAYRHAIRPILNRYNIPLQSLPSLLTSRGRGWLNSRYSRLNSDPNAPHLAPDDLFDDSDDYDEDNQLTDAPGVGGGNHHGNGRHGRRLSRDLEEGFRDSDDEEEEEDRRLGSGRNGNLRELPPAPVDEDRFPKTRI